MALPGQFGNPGIYLMVGLVLLVVLGLLWVVPQQQASWRGDKGNLDTMARFTIENESRKTLAQMATALALLAGLAFTWQQLLGTEDGRITDRYGKAIEQLDATKSVDVRLGGIYALERIGLQSSQDRLTIREVLAAFVRRHACWAGPDGDHPCPGMTETAKETTGPIPTFLSYLVLGGPLSIPPNQDAGGASPAPVAPDEDVRAALTVISNLSPGDDPPGDCLDLTYTSLPDMDLQNRAFQNVCFNDAYLRGIQFNGAQLHRAQFVGADLSGAHFEGATLTYAIMSGATLHTASFNGAILERTNLKRASLGGIPDDPGKDATGLAVDQLARACLDQSPSLPIAITNERGSRPWPICTP